MSLAVAAASVVFFAQCSSVAGFSCIGEHMASVTLPNGTSDSVFIVNCTITSLRVTKPLNGVKLTIVSSRIASFSITNAAMTNCDVQLHHTNISGSINFAQSPFTESQLTLRTTRVSGIQWTGSPLSSAAVTLALSNVATSGFSFAKSDLRNSQLFIVETEVRGQSNAFHFSSTNTVHSTFILVDSHVLGTGSGAHGMYWKGTKTISGSAFSMLRSTVASPRHASFWHFPQATAGSEVFALDCAFAAQIVFESGQQSPTGGSTMMSRCSTYTPQESTSYFVDAPNCSTCFRAGDCYGANTLAVAWHEDAGRCVCRCNGTKSVSGAPFNAQCIPVPLPPFVTPTVSSTTSESLPITTTASVPLTASDSATPTTSATPSLTDAPTDTRNVTATRTQWTRSITAEVRKLRWVLSEALRQIVETSGRVAGAVAVASGGPSAAVAANVGANLDSAINCAVLAAATDNGDSGGINNDRSPARTEYPLGIALDGSPYKGALAFNPLLLAAVFALWHLSVALGAPDSVSQKFAILFGVLFYAIPQGTFACIGVVVSSPTMTNSGVWYGAAIAVIALYAATLFAVDRAVATAFPQFVENPLWTSKEFSSFERAASSNGKWFVDIHLEAAERSEASQAFRRSVGGRLLQDFQFGTRAGFRICSTFPPLIALLASFRPASATACIGTNALTVVALVAYCGLTVHFAYFNVPLLRWAAVASTALLVAAALIGCYAVANDSSLPDIAALVFSAAVTVANGVPVLAQLIVVGMWVHLFLKYGHLSGDDWVDGTDLDVEFGTPLLDIEVVGSESASDTLRCTDAEESSETASNGSGVGSEDSSN